MRLTDSDIQRFSKKVTRRGPQECWPWKGCHSRGYGRMKIAGRMVKATHIALFLAGRPVPKGKLAMHSCDTPSCCNPDHIKPGTNLENVRDRDRKGRHRPMIGSANPMAKLTMEQAKEIRRLSTSGKSQRQLARWFNVSPTSIFNAVHSLTWRNE